MEQIAARQRAFKLAAAAAAGDEDDDDDDSGGDCTSDEGDEDEDEDLVAGPMDEDRAAAATTAATAAVGDGESTSWEESGTCVLCHRGPAMTEGRGKGDAAAAAGGGATVGPLCWVALAQRSNAPAVARRRAPAPPPRIANLASADPADGGGGGFVACYDCLGAGYTAMGKQSDGDNNDDDDGNNLPEKANMTETTCLLRGRVQVMGLHVMSCGHQVHTDCFDRYRTSMLSGGSEQLASRLQNGLSADEFHCPTCRRLCNAILPVLPPPPAQLHPRVAARRKRRTTIGTAELPEEEEEGMSISRHAATPPGACASDIMLHDLKEVVAAAMETSTAILATLKERLTVERREQKALRERAAAATAAAATAGGSSRGSDGEYLERALADSAATTTSAGLSPSSSSSPPPPSSDNASVKPPFIKPPALGLRIGGDTTGSIVSIHPRKTTRPGRGGGTLHGNVALTRVHRRARCRGEQRHQGRDAVDGSVAQCVAHGGSREALFPGLFIRR